MVIGTITLLSILFFGGGGFDLLTVTQDMEKKVEDVITDEARADNVRATIAGLTTANQALVEELRVGRGKIRELDLRHDATADDYRQAFVGLEQAWDAYEARALEIRSQLREQTTREEWDVLHEDMRKKLEKLDKK